jgi:ankyrin repeat protein
MRVLHSGWMPLHHALLNGHLGVVRYFIEESHMAGNFPLGAFFVCQKTKVKK